MLTVFMHPVGGGMYLPIVRGLAAAGHHVLWANSATAALDAALIMERVACDLGEAILDAKARLGYSKIVLAGMSGGGSVAMWYQALAEAGEGISDTAAGDVYAVDPARMPPADAIVMLVTHVGRHTLITEWMDASIRDEARPDDRDPGPIFTTRRIRTSRRTRPISWRRTRLLSWSAIVGSPRGPSRGSKRSGTRTTRTESLPLSSTELQPTRVGWMEPSIRATVCPAPTISAIPAW